MSWARGIDDKGREVGYAVKDTCHHPGGCKEKIDRGVAYRCGGQASTGLEEGACGDFFCGQHLFYALNRDGSIGAGPLCATCLAEWESEHAEEALL